MSRVLFTDAHLTVTIDEAAGVLRYARSATPFASIDAFRATHDHLTTALPAPLPRGLKLLVDVREAPPRNDEAFEAAVLRILATFMKRFPMHAFLVKSAVGRLQTNRLARERGGDAPAIFDDEGEALRYLGAKG